MAKPCVRLGEFLPYGQELLAGRSTGSIHRLVGNERDGVIADEELYIASDGRIVWSCGRHIIRGFQAPSRAVHLCLCGFSGLPAEVATDAAAAEGAHNAEAGACARRCLGVLEPDRFAIYAPGGSEFLAYTPLRAVRAWPLADGVLLLICSPQGTYHALTLVGHPLNLPRCVSYIEQAAVWKDTLPGAESGRAGTGQSASGPAMSGNSARICWVSAELPLAVAYLPKLRRHAVYLLRRRAHNPTVAVPEPPARPLEMGLETPAICREPSEVFLQQLWVFPDEGPACEPDNVFLLAPDPEYSMDSSGKASSGSGLLLVLFVHATQHLTIIRLWSWEVIMTLSCCQSAIALQPGDDLRARSSCPSGLAGFPSRWYGASHCRIVLQEPVGPPAPSTQGLPQPWADLLLDPLELTRSSAVLCFDRHRLPQYFLVLEADKRTLVLYWGYVKLCHVEVVDALTGERCFAQQPLTRLSDAVANRFTLHCAGRMYRCALPLQPHSPRLAAALTTLALTLPSELAHALAADAQVWCVQHGAGHGSSSDADDGEWRRFCELLFCLVEQVHHESSS